MWWFPLFFSSIPRSGALLHFKGVLDKYNIIPNFSPKKVGIFISLKVLAWLMTACWVSRSRFTYFWRNMNISMTFYFSKSTSINTHYSSLWDTLKMMLFTKYLIKCKRIGRISWKFRYWFDLKSSIDIRCEKIDVILVQCLFKTPETSPFRASLWPMNGCKKFL